METVMELLYGLHMDNCNFLPGTVEASFHLLGKFHDAVRKREERIIATFPDILTRMILRAALADNNLPDRDGLAILHLDAKTLGA